MANTQHVCLDEVVGYFDELEDPRSTVNQKHPLVSVVIIVGALTFFPALSLGPIVEHLMS